MNDVGRLCVFHRADDARAYNLPDKDGRTDFFFLPFAIIRDGDQEPPSDQIKASYQNYPLEFIRILLGIDWLVARGGWN